jgi:hypothetical protein
LQKFYDTYHTSLPFAVTFAVALVFVFTVGMFILYDWLVERRQKIVLHKAAQSTKIVSSLFPKQVCDRLLDDKPDLKAKHHFSGANKLKDFLSTGDDKRIDRLNDCTADLFPNCTVLFCTYVYS